MSDDENITSLDRLLEVTTCGITAQAHEQRIASVSVTNQGVQLAYWPPTLCRFARLSSVNLSGNAITFVPQSVQGMTGLRQLLLARNSLTSLPPEISCLTGLTELDVGGNQLHKLPDGLCKLTGLQVLNAWGNQLTALPEAIGCLTSLVRVGLKGNRLTALPASFPALANLVELFLTDNQLTTLPEGFGSLRSLVKLQASYNRFVRLPDDLWQLPALELFRLAVGDLEQWPPGLVAAGALPSLAWCSLGSNPAAAAVPDLPRHLPRVTRGQLTMGSKLGQGASGEVFAGRYGGSPVAVKVFLPGASPDGSTREEIAITCQNNHPSLTRVLALLVEEEGGPTAQPQQQPLQQPQQQQEGGSPDDAACSSSHHDGVIGLVMELVRGQPLADRPTSQHLLRCKWPAGCTFSSGAVASICRGVAGALAYLHGRSICHGDVYAHNIMLEGTDHAVLCDFGAAFCYDATAAGGFWEAMEVRAFGLFMQGLVERVRPVDSGADDDSSHGRQQQQQLRLLVDRCLAAGAAKRPTFAEVEQLLAC